VMHRQARQFCRVDEEDLCRLVGDGRFPSHHASPEADVELAAPTRPVISMS
jgi:hypothetical protein